MTNYWIKNDAYKEVLTKNLIPNIGGFNLMAYHFNAMNQKGIGFYFDKEIKFLKDKVFRKNGYEYLVLEYDDFKELLILPNDHIEEYANRVASKLNSCNNENAILNLLIAEM